jgi:flagellar basal-body rod protein FlgC
MFEGFDISVSGMVANRIWSDTIAGNLANINTTRDEYGRANPYQRRFPIFEPAEDGRGVQVAGVEADDSFRWQSDPGHPDAETSGSMKGYVRMPNIEVHTETVNSMIAMRAYEANLTALQVTKQMISSDLRILA